MDKSLYPKYIKQLYIEIVGKSQQNTLPLPLPNPCVTAVTRYQKLQPPARPSLYFWPEHTPQFNILKKGGEKRS